MKYICTICGYMYDDDVEKIPFSELPDDWTCPLCGASKDLFEPVETSSKKDNNEKKENPVVSKDGNRESKKLYADFTAGEMSALFSSLANGCEKQYEFEAQKKFIELADYFESKALDLNQSDAELFAMLKEDSKNEYPAAKEQCREDRGTLRALTWGEKVTKVQQMMVSQGPDTLKNKNLYVCSVCGFMYIGEVAPKLCPVCKVPDWKFIKI